MFKHFPKIAQFIGKKQKKSDLTNICKDLPDKRIIRYQNGFQIWTQHSQISYKSK